MQMVEATNAESKMAEVMNMNNWVEENKSSFKPPVCNKLMYGAGQLKIMFVGGPNSRKDYHIEEGEEFFFMLQGDMCLKIMEKGTPKDVIIKEGEVFVLPSRIPHSPQRMEDTVGLVIERERLPEETDGLRYYCEDGVSVLFEKWFHCYDLVKDLPPLINEYKASEQFKTGKPIPGTIPENPPVKIDVVTEVHKPFHLMQWITSHIEEIKAGGMKKIFEHGEFKISVYSKGKFEHQYEGETWLWQLDGDATLKLASEVRNLKKGDVTLVPANCSFLVDRGDGSLGILVIMDPSAAKCKA